MKEYSLFIDDAVSGPLPQAEIEAKIKRGELPADVMIAAPGDAEWRPAKEVLNIRPSVRLSRKSAEEEKRLREARKEELDSEVRRKLMLYDLADATSVDKFSPKEAAAAIAAYERKQANVKYTKISIGIGAFALTFGAVFFTLDNVRLSGNNRSLLAPITEMMVEPSGELTAQIRSTAKDIEALDKLREEINALEFKMPAGGRSPEREFIKRVYIPKDESNFISGKVDASPILSAILPDGKKPNSIEIFFTKRVSTEARKALEEAVELLALLKTPLWTDEELATKASEALESILPAPESGSASRYAQELKAQLTKLTAATIEQKPAEWATMLSGEVDRQDSQGRFYNPIEKKRLLTRTPDKEMLTLLGSAKLKKEIENLPKDSPSKLGIVRWCVHDMPPFLDKFQKFVDDNRVFYSAKTRETLWKNFTDKSKNLLAEEFELASTDAFPLAEDGSFRIPGTRITGMCLSIRFGDTLLYVPSDLKIPVPGSKNEVKAFSVKGDKRERVKKEDLVHLEKYRVAKKISVGGKTYFATGKVNRKPVQILRTAPILNYIELERQGENDPKAKPTKNICLRVPDKAEFDGMAIGSIVPVEQLLKYEMFQEPKETLPPSKLALLPKNTEE